MSYRVVLAESFTDDLDRQVAYLLREEASIATVGRWLSKLYQQVLGLDEFPHRFPVDRYQSETSGRETRKLNFGEYLVFYQVDDARCQVNVVAFAHGAGRHGT
jgi:plasmid stabilization system protein ParE